MDLIAPYMLDLFYSICVAVFMFSVYMMYKDNEYWNKERASDPTYYMTDEERRQMLRARDKERLDKIRSRR